MGKKKPTFEQHLCDTNPVDTRGTGNFWLQILQDEFTGYEVILTDQQYNTRMIISAGQFENLFGLYKRRLNDWKEKGKSKNE